MMRLRGKIRAIKRLQAATITVEYQLVTLKVRFYSFRDTWTDDQHIEQCWHKSVKHWIRLEQPFIFPSSCLKMQQKQIPTSCKHTNSLSRPTKINTNIILLKLCLIFVICLCMFSHCYNRLWDKTVDLDSWINPFENETFFVVVV